VSRKHFEIGPVAGRAGKYAIRDLGSAGGTFIRIAYGHKKRLHTGTMILMGKHQFMVSSIDDTGAASGGTGGGGVASSSGHGAGAPVASATPLPAGGSGNGNGNGGAAAMASGNPNAAALHELLSHASQFEQVCAAPLSPWPAPSPNLFFPLSPIYTIPLFLPSRTSLPARALSLTRASPPEKPVRRQPRQRGRRGRQGGRLRGTQRAPAPAQQQTLHAHQLVDEGMLRCDHYINHTTPLSTLLWLSPVALFLAACVTYRR